MSNNIGNENDVKLITLDHIQQIKDYVDRTDRVLNDRIDNEIKDYVSDELKQAAEQIQADHDLKYKELQDKLAYLEQFGTQEEIDAIKLKIEALEGNTQNKFEALEGLERELGRLSGDYQNLYDGIITGKVFNAGQLDEIINTALIEKTTITDDMVETPNVYTSNLVALIGKFGQINAANIVGGEISGHTIQSNNKMVGTDTPVWQIKDAGDGHLAGENIKWDANGNVTFGSGVKITFDNVQGAEDKLKELMSNYDDDLQKYVEEAVKTSAAGAISREELEKRVQETKAAADEAIDNLKNVIAQNNADLNDALSNGLNETNEALQESLNDALNKVNSNIEASYNKSSADLQNELSKVNIAIDKAVAEGRTDLLEKLANIKGSLEAYISHYNQDIMDIRNAINSLKGDIENMGESALDPDNIADLLSASLITKTEISDTQVITPSLLAKKIVGLVGTFGTINASKIVGTNIQGYTISSPLDVKDVNGNPVYTDEYEQALDENGNPMTDENGNPVYVTQLNPSTNEYEPVRKKKQIKIEDAAWVLNQDGSGHLANGNIEWKKTGNLQIGGKDGITVSEKSGKYSINLGSAVEGIKYEIDWDNVDLENNPALKSALEELVNAEIKDVDDAIVKINKQLESIDADSISDLNQLATKIKEFSIETGIIQSTATKDGEPLWKLDVNGGGHLAGGNISWDDKGKVKLKPDVEITWDNFKGGKDAVNDAVNESLSGIVDDKVETAVNNSIGDISDKLAAAETIQTKIKGDGIYTGTVAAVIEGHGNVTSKDLSVADAKWALKDDGSGWLANGGIRWGSQGGLMLKGAIRHSWKDITTGTIEDNTINFIIPNNTDELYQIDTNEWVPKNSNYKIYTQLDYKNIISLPTNDHWDGTEITIMNYGNTYLLLGNALVSDNIGEVSNYNNAVTPSGLSYSIGPGSLINFIGIKDHPFTKTSSTVDGNVSWFTTSAGNIQRVKAYPMNIQLLANDPASSAALGPILNINSGINGTPIAWHCRLARYGNTSTINPSDVYIGKTPNLKNIGTNGISAIAIKPSSTSAASLNVNTGSFEFDNVTATYNNWLLNNWGDNTFFEIWYPAGLSRVIIESMKIYNYNNLPNSIDNADTGVTFNTASVDYAQTPSEFTQYHPDYKKNWKKIYIPVTAFNNYLGITTTAINPEKLIKFNTRWNTITNSYVYDASGKNLGVAQVCIVITAERLPSELPEHPEIS